MQSLYDRIYHFPTGGCQGKGCAEVQRARGRRVLLLSLALGLLSGCSRSDALTFPTYSPDRIAQEALAEYDANHDGYLDAKELERCPALKAALKSIDQNGDNRLGVDEIAGRIRTYQESGAALKHVGCRLLLDGRPLQGATVTYVPEKFMGTSIKPASGVTDKSGQVSLIAEGEKYPGAQPGFYRVQVSKKNANGQETIPARYNQDTTLGTEVYPLRKRVDRRAAMTDDESGLFRLSSKSK